MKQFKSESEVLKYHFLEYARDILPTKPTLKNLHIKMVAGFLDYATIIATSRYSINGVKKIDIILIRFDGVDFTHEYI